MKFEWYMLPLLPIVVVVFLSILHWTIEGVKFLHNHVAIRKGAREARRAERERKARNHNRVLPQEQKVSLAVILERWFSIKRFLSTLLLSAGWSYLVVASRVSGATGKETAYTLGLFMVMGTGMVTFLAVISILGNEWRPDDRPFAQRAWVSGRAWVTMALAMIPINAFLLFW